MCLSDKKLWKFSKIFVKNMMFVVDYQKVVGQRSFMKVQLQMLNKRPE